MPSAIETIKEGRASTYKIRRKHIILRGEKDLGRNPRIDFGELEDLAKQIGQHGIRTPLSGTMEGKKFAVGHGERRLKAFDLAVERGWLNPKTELGLIPVTSEAFNASTADRDRLILHVVLNESKPLTQLEKGEAIKRLQEDHQMDEKQIAEQLGYTTTAIRDCLSLVNGAAPEVQEAVRSGKMSSTAAIDLVREVPDKEAQASVYAKAEESAEAAGASKVTAKHLPIATGKAAQASRRRSGDPFAGKDSTPDTPTSNAKGEYTQGVQALALTFKTKKKVTAAILTALIGSTYHIGWRLTWPGKKKGDGFLNVHPSTGGITADNETTANLLALQQIRAEFEAKDFPDKSSVLEDLDERIKEFGEKSGEAEETKPAKSGGGKGGGVANPVLKDKDPTGELKEIIDAIDAKDAEKDRLATAKKIHAFLKGKLQSQDLTKYLLGI